MKKSGFTLVEMLVVIAVIGILAGMLIPLASTGGESAKKRKAALEANALKVAVEQFHDDHHYMPYKKDKNSPKLGEDAWVATDDKEWMEVLQGENALKKNYLEAKTDDKGVLKDPWGHAYRVGMDRNLDGRVEVDSKGQATVKTAKATVVVVSAGPDGEFDKNSESQESDKDKRGDNISTE